MNRIEEIREIVKRNDINTHPFYKAWSEGCLPVDRLQIYAREYGNYIATIPAGWETIGEKAIAEEEREHHGLWLDFVSSVGSAPEVSVPQISTLVGVANSLSLSTPEALGALYAFEVQQPVTSRTKLDGLQKHYWVGEAGEKYFADHADDWSEPELLEKHMLTLSDEEFSRTKSAAAMVSAGMWLALDGVLAA